MIKFRLNKSETDAIKKRNLSSDEFLFLKKTFTLHPDYFKNRGCRIAKILLSASDADHQYEGLFLLIAGGYVSTSGHVQFFTKKKIDFLEVENFLGEQQFEMRSDHEEKYDKFADKLIELIKDLKN